MPEADLLQVEFAARVRCEQTGSLALRAIETAGFDLAIIDVNLPEISGYVLARRAVDLSMRRHRLRRTRRHDRVWTNQREATKVIATNPTPLGVDALSSRQCAAQGGSVMRNKTWAFALALALAAAPVSSLLAAGPGGAAGGGAAGGGAGSLPNGENAMAGTAAANASTPAAKMDPAGAKPSSPNAGDPAATNKK